MKKEIASTETKTNNNKKLTNNIPRRNPAPPKAALKKCPQIFGTANKPNQKKKIEFQRKLETRNKKQRKKIFF